MTIIRATTPVIYTNSKIIIVGRAALQMTNNSPTKQICKLCANYDLHTINMSFYNSR